MKRLILTALLVVTANTVSATSLSIKHNKKLPTPYELITKGTILNKTDIKQGQMYFIAWDKTEDIYWCGVTVLGTDCYLMEQGTRLISK